MACTKFQMAMEMNRRRYKIKIIAESKKVFPLKEVVYNAKNDAETNNSKNIIPKTNGTECEIKARLA